jgi:hypothetical protein
MHIVAMKQTRDSGGPGADAITISQNYQVDVSLGLAIPMLLLWPQYVHWLVHLLEGIQDS